MTSKRCDQIVVPENDDRRSGDEIMSEDAEIARLKEALDELHKRLERSTSTLFEPGDELVWFDKDEVDTMGAHTHISGPLNYFIHQADGCGSDQFFMVKRYDEETLTTIIIGRNLPDWETATAVAQADFRDAGAAPWLPELGRGRSDKGIKA